MPGRKLMTGVVIALSVAIAFLAVLVVGLLRSHAEILRKLDSLGVAVDEGGGQGHRMDLARVAAGNGEVDDISGLTPEGEIASLSPNLGDDPTLIAFLSTSCSSCTVFWEAFDGSTRYFGDVRHRVVIVTLGAEEESPTRALSLRRGQADVVMSSEAWSEFEVPGAPYFVLVDGDRGVVGEGSAQTYEALEEFLTDSSNDARWDSRRSGDDDESRIDRDLKAAGIEPGDPRLYPEAGDLRGGEG
jgi:hypothetical protein